MDSSSSSTTKVIIISHPKVYQSSGEDSLFDGSADETFSMKLKKFWTRTSLGGFSAPSNRFYEAELIDSSNTLALTCPKGKFSIDPEVTYFGLIGEDEFAIYTMYMIDSTCNKDDIFQERVKICEDKSACEVQFDKSWFDTNCLNSFDTKKKLYLKMYCKESTLEIFGRTYTKEQYSLFIVSVNILTLISFLIYLLVIGIMESNLKKYYEKKNASPNDYTIQLKNLPEGIKEQDMIGKLYEHLNKFAGEKKMENPVIDVTVALQNEVFTLNKMISENDDMLTFYYEELKAKKYMNGKDIDKTLNFTHLRLIIDELEKSKRNIFYKNFLDKKSANKIFKKLLKFAKKKKDAIKRKLLLVKEKTKVLRAFVTFDTIEHKNTFVKNMRTSSCQRCCFNKKKKEFDLKLFESKVLKVTEPPQPINIKWENMTYTGKAKLTRRCISWFLTITLFLICMKYYF